MADWIKEKKRETFKHAAYKRFMSELKTQTESERMEKDIHANRNDKIVGVAILKVNFKTKAITEDKEGYYIMMNGSVKKRTFYSLTYIYTQYRIT